MNLLIIGNGIAGVTVAETVRAADKTATITIVSDEPYAFYSRPRLIEVLSGKSTIEQITIHPLSWYEKNSIALERSTAIQSVDFSGKKAVAANGKIFTYDKLVIASGAACSVPPIEGSGLSGVFTLRTADDVESMRKRALTNKKTIVIGGGLLGIEAANSLKTLGQDVTIVEMFDRLLPRQLDHDGADLLQHLLEKNGLNFLVGRQTKRIIAHESGLCIELADGSSCSADQIIISAGIKPNTAFLAGSGIAAKRGILVDNEMRTSISDTYAVGDVVEYNGCLYGLWQAAREQGQACGKSIAGTPVPYKGSVPSTRLKVAGVDVASIGAIADDVSSTVDKSIEAGTYRRLFTKNNALIGAILVGDVKDAMKLQQEIKVNESVQTC